MYFHVELPRGASLFPASPNGVYTTPVNLEGIHAPWNLESLKYYAFRCNDIRNGLDGLEYFINGEWYVLRQEDGSQLGLFQVTQLLQVTFDDDVCVSTGKTKVPDALWTLAGKIRGDVYASHIAKTFLANDIKAIQEARQKRGK